MSGRDLYTNMEFDKLVSDFSRFCILTILYERPIHGNNTISKFRDRVGKTISPVWSPRM